MKKVLVLSILLLLILVRADVSQAQSGNAFNQLDITGLINIIITPENPGPYENITAKLEASGINLNSSLITWRLDGAVVASGQGEKEISFGTGPIGSRSNITVTIEASAGTFTKSIIISSSEIDFLWQGDTSVPPFYVGRSLWSSQSTLTILAIPHIGSTEGGEMNPLTLNYRWTQNGKVLGSLSGKGRNTLTFTDSIISAPQTIKLEILSDKNVRLAGSSITLRPTRPSILVYEKNPLYGISFHKEVGANYLMREKEVTFTSYPLFFSMNNIREGSLVYNWLTNVGTMDTGNSVTYRVPEKASGSSEITAKITNSSKLLQSGQKNFLVQFRNPR